VTERTDPFNHKTLSAYDKMGRLISQTDRNNQTITSDYTASGKINSINYPNDSVSFDYDSRDNLVSMTDPLGTTSNSFNALNRLTEQTDPNGFVVKYDYDSVSNLTQLTYPGNKTVSYTYDELNRVDGITIDWLGVTATPVYDNAGRLTDISHFNGSSTAYRYDNADRLTGIGHQANGQSLVDTTYTLDAGGNRTEVISNKELIQPILISDVQSHDYNSFKNRLTQATIEGTSVLFNYDNEGQLQSKGSTGYTFDSAHRMTGVANNSYQYDGVGNRLIATRNGIVTQYIYDAAGNLLAEANAADVIQRYYIYGLGLMAMVDAQTGQLYVYHFDGTGHTVAMTNSAQAVVNKYGYTPFGKLMGKVETVPQPFTYVGQYGVMTEADGIYYMRARYYDAGVMRFISEDPIGFAGGLNLYAYTGGNPVNAIDPSGLDYLIANNGILTHYNDTGNMVGSYPYTTGQDGVTDASIPWKGPIPPGTYSLNPKQISEGGFLRNLLADWGKYRVPITPDSTTNTFGRDGFFLHGGKKPGSAGCIDVGGGDKTLFPQLLNHDGAIPITVKP
ncbi:MAG: DUF2778 domain-containing protein, partial [gamma proteobacterium symbiont of Bathyaustriella thionipta]|nr:DUF2778 domain-containing protein [gamma proteobacterium symbiont of Bathyaustriella thionipta]